MPLSNNVDLESVWYEKEQPAAQATQTAGQASAPVAAGNDALRDGLFVTFWALLCVRVLPCA